MPLARVQGTGTNNASGTTLALAFAGNVVAGNLIIACSSTTQVGHTNFTITDDLSNSYTEDYETSTSPMMNVSKAMNISGGACTVTVTVNQSEAKHLNIMEVSGAATTAADDGQDGGGTGTSTSPDSGAGLTSTVADDIIIGYVHHSGAATVSAEQIGAVNADGENSTSSRTAMWWRIVTATGTYDATATLSASLLWRCQAAAYEQAAAGANVPFRGLTMTGVGR